MNNYILQFNNLNLFIQVLIITLIFVLIMVV